MALTKAPLSLLNVGSAIQKILRGTAALDFPSILGGAQATLTIAVVGAKVGDSVALSLPATGGAAGLVYDSYVSAADVVTVVARNVTATPVDAPSATFGAVVTSY